MMDKPTLTQEDRELFHYNPNTDDIIERVKAHGEAMAAWGAAQERERWLRSVGPAYGYLWCVNNEPGTPNQYPPERAAYEARKLLRDLLTKVERGEFINTVVQNLRPAQQGD